MADGESVVAYLTSKGLPPSPVWLQEFMSSVKSTTPMPAIQKTALFRIQAADLTTTVQPSQTNCFPANINEPGVREMRIVGPVTVQLLNIDDIGRSNWSQVEAIEACERGETTKGREIIRVAPEEGNDTATPANQVQSKGPHKLLLQDANGTKVYAFEISPIQVGVHTPIGTKILVKNVVAARGVVLLEPQNIEMIGGKVAAWDKAWRAERKQVLTERAGMTSDASST